MARRSLPFAYPDVDELRDELIEIRDWLRAEKLEDTEVRLQVLRGRYIVHTGDPQYDTDHGGVWGDGVVGATDSAADLEEIAQEMIDAAAEQEEFDEMDDEA